MKRTFKFKYVLRLFILIVLFKGDQGIANSPPCSAVFQSGDKISTFAQEIGIKYLITLTYPVRFLNLLESYGFLKKPGDEFFLSAHSSELTGAPMKDGAGIFGGKYNEGNLMYFISKEEILDRSDYHATPQWGTAGKKTEASVDVSDKSKMQQYLENLVDHPIKQNEVVFKNSKENPVTLDYLKEIWIHPNFQLPLLQSLKDRGITPPEGRAWEEVVRGVTTVPEVP